MNLELASFFQSLIPMLLERRLELRGMHPEWVRQVLLMTDNSGFFKDVIITLNIPINEKLPALNIYFGSSEMMFEHGKIVSKKVDIRIRLS